MTINRFCSSGLQAVAIAADRIRLGEADVMIAGGTESMSMVPMGGNKPSFNPAVFERDENVGIAYGMGLTAEKVAAQWKVSARSRTRSRSQSHRRRWRRRQAGEFGDEITPVDVVERCPTSPPATSTIEDAHRARATKVRAPTRRRRASPS